jgi:4-alpha-glucanotransferase
MLFREWDGSYSDPKRYPRLSLAQPATHDHTPLALQWAECWANIDADRDVDNSRAELRRIMNFSGLRGEEPPRELTDRVHEHFMRAVLGANSWLTVFQITDVFAQKERFNTPGSMSQANWSHRLAHTVKQLDEDPSLAAKAEMFSRIAKESGRVA